MNNLLAARLKRLEKSAEMDNPFAHLTDEELDARLKELTDQIEISVGMPSAEYADALCNALDAGEALPENAEAFPDGWTEESVREYAAMLRRIAGYGL